MHKALRLKPCANACLVHQANCACLKDACTDAAQDIVTRFALQHHGVDALGVEELSEEEARGATADDDDLGTHGLPF